MKFALNHTRNLRMRHPESSLNEWSAFLALWVRGKDGRGWLPIHGYQHLCIGSGGKQILAMETAMAEAVVTESATPIAAVEDAY